MNALPLDAEWLESDAMGGFASGTVGGYRTRRYHALLLVPRQAPGDRVVLVNGVEVWIEFPGGSFPLSTQHYAPDVIHPRAIDHLVSFVDDPWPTWAFRTPTGIDIVHECVVERDSGSVLLAWRMAGPDTAAVLRVRPLLSGRNIHALMRENPDFAFAATIAGGQVSWHPYAQLPAIVAVANAAYVHDPVWYRNFLYRAEAARGLDCVEDLASPGTFTFDMRGGEASLVLRAGDIGAGDAGEAAGRIRRVERTRRGNLTRLDRAADAYIVRRGRGHTIIAGFPWFLDWGRDTFIALRGLCIARGRYDIAESILLAWSETISEGMLPNRFPDRGEAPEYNSVDASLWYAIAAHELLMAADLRPPAKRTLIGTREAILDAYMAGTRFGIRMDANGLLACGVPGMQLTWMDAKVGDRVITARIGKPVEVQALWINALRCAGGRYAAMAQRAQAAFQDRFWNESAGCLYDVVDADHVPGRVDERIRPNQIFAVGGLPQSIFDGKRARAVVSTVERELLTPMGLRSLSPRDPSYRAHYQGDALQRDAAYHQGTVWPWLIGAFVDAWLRVSGDDGDRRAEARRRFLAPLQTHVGGVGFGHLCEIADGDPPHTPRGCPFQAWSLGEYLRSLARTTNDGAA